LRDHYLPLVMVVFKPLTEGDIPIASLAPFTRTMNAVGGKATAYVCTGHTCAVPVTDPRQMLELLGLRAL